MTPTTLARQSYAALSQVYNPPHRVAAIEAAACRSSFLHRVGTDGRKADHDALGRLMYVMHAHDISRCWRRGRPTVAELHGQADPTAAMTIVTIR